MRQVYECKRKKKLEGDRGIKEKYLFAFSRGAGVSEMQFALKKAPEVGDPDPRGRAGDGPEAWVWLPGSGLLVPFTRKGREGWEGLRQEGGAVDPPWFKGEANHTGTLHLLLSAWLQYQQTLRAWGHRLRGLRGQSARRYKQQGPLGARGQGSSGPTQTGSRHHCPAGH